MTEPVCMPPSAEPPSDGGVPLQGRLLLVLILLGPESALFAAFAAGQVDLAAYLQCHLGLCAAVAVFGGWWAARSASRPADRIAMVLQLVAWTALAGPFGTFIAIGLLVPHAAAGVGSGDSATSPVASLSRLEGLHRALLDSRLRLDRAHVIRPLLDVIIEGTQGEKFDALSLISKRYVPAAAPALKRALEDKDGSVRVLAATVMAQQHNAMTKRIGDRQAAARATPDHPGGWSALGQAHLDYAGSGLLEASRAETELGQARVHLARAEQLGGDMLTKSRLDVLDRLAGIFGLPAAESAAALHGP